MDPTNALFSNEPAPYMKCYEARNILIEEWSDEYHRTPFLSLVDLDKLISLPIFQFGLILKSKMLNDAEKVLLKRKRQQAKKNVATELLRKKNREQDHLLEESVRVLEEKREVLLRTKEELIEEIAHYQNEDM
ncbi:hypothetical protein LOD99_625 [Oopsacas minuta]|uniref:BZIP domain-containing protein n=1 Tax=Oopsacas minuta TaxID=111878 RepID=A0AAV7JZU3_9METZ|nr:hypothetical protein LOD99_625 [Oopsacas minuta]